jgi:hypothetical protein
VKKQRSRKPAPRRKPTKDQSKLARVRYRLTQAIADAELTTAYIRAQVRAAEERMPPEVRDEYRALNRRGGNWREGSEEERRLGELNDQYLDAVTREEIEAQIPVVLRKFEEELDSGGGEGG